MHKVYYKDQRMHFIYIDVLFLYYCHHVWMAIGLAKTCWWQQYSKSISITLKWVSWSLIYFMHVLSYFTVKSVKHKMLTFNISGWSVWMHVPPVQSAVTKPIFHSTASCYSPLQTKHFVTLLFSLQFILLKILSIYLEK